MTVLRTIFVCLFGLCALGHGLENKKYVPIEDIEFSQEGIFVRTEQNTWEQVGQIAHDSQGYFFSEKQAQEEWSCPACHAKNPSDTEVCRRCGWPFSDELPWKK